MAEPPTHNRRPEVNIMHRLTVRPTLICILALIAASQLAVREHDSPSAIAADLTFGRQPQDPDAAKKPPKQRVKPRMQRSSTKMPALSFKMKDIDGKEQDLRQYYGDVILLVNVASRCGYTPQYKGLQKLYEEKKDKGFVILGFPANNFGQQEPGSDSQIRDFCSKNYNVTFPLFSKVSVKGDDCCPLYQYLTDKKAGHKYGGDVKWNFNKFLVNRKGEVVARFDSNVAPDSEKLLRAIDKALAAPRPDDAPRMQQKKD